MPHYVKPTINGDDIRLEFTCTEPPGADCKIQCPVDPKDPYGCETFALERDEDGNPWHIGYRYDDETDEETDGRLHQMLPIDRCIILEWDDIAENYAGDPGLLREGEIKFTWQEDYYEWEYANTELNPYELMGAAIQSAIEAEQTRIVNIVKDYYKVAPKAAERLLALIAEEG